MLRKQGHLHHANRWPWERVFFEGEGGEGEGEQGGGSGSGEGEGKGAGEGEGKTFTQAELDRIVQDRLARERKRFEGHDELKRKAEQYDKLQEEQQSELERERTAREKAEAERDRIAAEARETSLRAALLAEAAKPERRVADPEAAVILLDRELLEYNDDGSPKNAKEAVDSLLEQRPYLVAAEQPGGGRRDPADQGPRQTPEATNLESLDDPAKVRESVRGLRK